MKKGGKKPKPKPKSPPRPKYKKKKTTFDRVPNESIVLEAKYHTAAGVINILLPAGFKYGEPKHVILVRRD